MVYLGNISINDFEWRTGYVFSDEEKKWLEDHRQDNATISYNSNSFHIFNIPLAIHVSETIYDKLMTILNKQEDILSSREPIMILSIKETEPERIRRELKEKEEAEDKARKENPNALWLVKYYMLVPVMVNNRRLYYDCFINVYIKGYNNITDYVDGYGWVMRDEIGLHGQFTLNDGTTDWVVGCSFYDERGKYIGSRNWQFERTTFSIREAIERAKQMNNNALSKSISFVRIEK